MKAAAIINGPYRYYLSRCWDDAKGIVTWIMLNPSTADATMDDPTIRRCLGFSRRWGFGGIVVVNLYAYRATKPTDLWDAAGAGVDPVGPLDDEAIMDAAKDAELVVAAWGAHGVARNRGLVVTEGLTAAGINVDCLGLTKNGQPRHPLYLKDDTRVRLYATVQRPS